MKAKKRARQTAPPERPAAPVREISKPLLVGMCVLLALAALLVYVQTFHYGFIAYDDDQYVYENAMVKAGLSASGIGWALTTFFYSNWHPLTWISYMLDAQLFGIDAGWFHAVNVMLHLGATVLLFLALVRMTQRPLRCALVAGIFALHPLHVESVAWISERKDVLSTFLEMVALLLYIRYVESRTVRRYLLLTGAFALSLMAKPMLVTFPFVLLLLDFWPLRRLEWPPRWTRDRTLLLEKVPLLVLSAIASVLTFSAQHTYGAVVALERLPVTTRLANAALGYVAYIGEAIWPVNLGVLYPVSPPSSDVAALAAVLMLAVTAAAFAFARSRPYILTGWLWYAGMLVPVIGLVQVGAQSRADRYTYAPLIGLSIAVIWIVGDWMEKRPHLRRAAAVAAGAILLALAAGAYRQAGYWRGSRALFEHTLAVTGPNHIIRNNLGVILAGEGDFQGAMSQYRQAVAIDPDYADGHANVGHELLREGHLDQAAGELHEALRLQPKLPVAEADLGTLLAARGDYQGAILHLTESLRAKPDNAHAESNLCFVLLHNTQGEEALPHCQRALRLEPDFADAHFNLGTVLSAQGRKAEARAEFMLAIRYNPGHVGAKQALADMGGK